MTYATVINLRKVAGKYGRMIEAELELPVRVKVRLYPWDTTHGLLDKDIVYLGAKAEHLTSVVVTPDNVPLKMRGYAISGELAQALRDLRTYEEVEHD